MTVCVEHPLLGEVVLSRTKRTRRITIHVRASGAIRISCPYGIKRSRAIEFLDEKAEWVQRTRRRLLERQALRPQAEPLSPEAQKARIEELRGRAKADLPLRIERISTALGLHYEGLTIRASRTKWGSCTSRNTISLSLFLMLLPEHLRDYVIVHELCHTVHHDHSPNFHALVDRCLGGREKELTRELKGYRIDW